jgi:hypothetical protein
MTTSSVVLSWQNGSNPAGTLYTVERNPTGTGFVTTLTVSATNTFTDSAPLAGTAVTYIVVPTGTNLQGKINVTFSPSQPAPAPAATPPAPAPSPLSPAASYPSDAVLASFAKDADGYPIYPVPANAIVANPSSTLLADQQSAIANGSLCVLLKRGAVYPANYFAHGGWQVPGQSWKKPFILGATGDVQNAKPICQGMMGIGGGVFTKAPMQYMIAFSLDFQDPSGMPGAAGFCKGSSYEAGIRLVGDCAGNLILDDISVQGFQGGIEIQGTAQEIIETCILFRCNVRNNFGQRWGVYVQRVHDLLIQEGMYDQNGWSPANAAAGWTGVGKSIFCHNLYLQETDASDAADAQVRVKGIATTRASSHGLQCRPGGLIDGVWFWGNPLAGFAFQRASTLSNSVIEGGGFDLSIAGQARGFGFQSNGCPAFEMTNVVHCDKSDPVNSGAAIQITCTNPDSGAAVATGFSASGAIVNNWTGAACQVQETPGKVAFDATCDVAGYPGAGTFKYVDATRTALKFAQSQGLADVPTMLGAMYQNRRGSFNSKLTAEAINAFVLGGFAHAS